jgi:hypothetical protein
LRSDATNESALANPGLAHKRRFAIWCAAGSGVQGMLVEADPDKFFVPPYVGHRGWLGVRLGRGLDWNELAGIVEDAYAEVAPPKLVEAATRSEGPGARP